jgi:asparagine synthase (glutamine-hydrolysing)
MGALEICFSDLELALGAGYAPPGVDEEFIREWLTYPFLRTARTGLSGCEELHPGCVRISCGSARSVDAVWSPWKAACAEREIRDFDAAANRLREVALATIPAQLRGIERPLLKLSGGLDSSIVATCLRRGGVDFRAATFATKTPAGDERDYARRLASHLEVELIEEEEDELPLDLSPPLRRTLRPPLSPVLQPLDRAFSRAAKECRSRNLVTGAGGDNIFCYLTTAAPALDAFEQLPLRTALRALQDVAALGECTLWKAGRYTLRKRLRRGSRARWARDERFLAPSAPAAAPDPHPWLLPPERPSAGKLEHVEALVRIQHFLQPRHVSGEAMHHPLISQPLIETCLSIPSWLWVRGGRNRAVARQAFADLLPPAIVRRRSKGSLAGMCSKAFADNCSTLYDLLVGGELSERGLIDEGAVRAYLRTGQSPNDDYFRIFDLVSLELWLRAWRA